MVRSTPVSPMPPLKVPALTGVQSSKLNVGPITAVESELAACHTLLSKRTNVPSWYVPSGLHVCTLLKYWNRSYLITVRKVRIKL